MINKDDVKQLGLICPESHVPLELADDALVRRLNERVAAGSLCYVSGVAVEDAMGGALVRQDGLWAYPIVGEIPKLVPDAAIPLDQLPADDKAGENHE